MTDLTFRPLPAIQMPTWSEWCPVHRRRHAVRSYRAGYFDPGWPIVIYSCSSGAEWTARDAGFAEGRHAQD